MQINNLIISDILLGNKSRKNYHYKKDGYQKESHPCRSEINFHFKL